MQCRQVGRTIHVVQLSTCEWFSIVRKSVSTLLAITKRSPYFISSKKQKAVSKCFSWIMLQWHNSYKFSLKSNFNTISNFKKFEPSPCEFMVASNTVSSVTSEVYKVSRKASSKFTNFRTSSVRLSSNLSMKNLAHKATNTGCWSLSWCNVQVTFLRIWVSGYSVGGWQKC